MAFKAAPLPHEYMLIGIIGFFVSVFFIMEYSRTWGFAFALFSLLLVIASIVSMSTTEMDEKTLDLIAGESYQRYQRPTLKKEIKKEIKREREEGRIRTKAG